MKLEKRAADLLNAHPHFQGRNRWVQCRFANDRMYLTGTVPSFYLKQMAQEALRQLDGVEEIVNRIVVVSPTGLPAESTRAGFCEEQPAHKSIPSCHNPRIHKVR